MNRVQMLAAEAVSTLAHLLSADTLPAVRLGAARTVTELAVQQYEAEVIVKRLEELEQRVK
jgi:hypothetical protein